MESHFSGLPHQNLGTVSTATLFRPETREGPRWYVWSRSIISHVFTQWIVLWEARNKSVHGEDSSAQAKSKNDQAMRELEILYSFKDQVLHRDRQLFFDDIAPAHKEKTTSSIRQWLNSYRSLLLQSLKEAKIKSLSNVRTLDHYFKVL
jgi:hypothetical protein